MTTNENDNHTPTQDPNRERQAHQTALVVAALAAVVVLAFVSMVGISKVTGGGLPGTSPAKGKHYSVGTRMQLVTACEAQGTDFGGNNPTATSSSCVCLVDTMAEDGLKEEVVQAVISRDEPQSKLEGPMEAAAKKCGIHDVD